MPKAGIHSAFSSNWKSGEVASNLNQSWSETRKTTSEVQSAIERAFRATAASSPRVAMMMAAPTSGRKVVRVSSISLPCRPEEVPGDEGDDPDHDREGV